MAPLTRMEIVMTKTKTQQAAASYFDGFTRAFDEVGAKIQVPEATRDFFRTQAATAAQRAEELHRQAASLADQSKSAFGPFAGSFDAVTRTMLDATLANTQHYFATIEKLADANSVGEALTIQADYVREATAANMERIRTGADQAKSLMADNVKVVQEQVKKAA